MTRIAWVVASCLLLARVATAQSEAESSVLVETTAIVSGLVSQTISVYGTVEPDPDSLTVIALPRAGLITSLSVRLGERVHAGDPLLVLDTAPSARAQYAQAAAARDYAEGQLQRSRQLFADQLATREQVAAAERAVSEANAQLNALANVGANLNRQTIRAVNDGIVTALSVNVGDRVAADTPVVVIAQARGVVVRFGIEPEDARRVPVAAPLQIVSVFQSDIRIATKLEKVGAMINPATRLVDAIAPVPEASVSQLTLGSIMRADIYLEEQTALLVPRSAVLRDQDGAYVFAVSDNRAQRVNVVVVYESGTETGIESVLEEGAVVVRMGNYELSDGMLVRTEIDSR